MKPAQISRTRGAARALAGAALSACLVASIGLVSSSAAEPAAEPHDGPAATHGLHDAMVRHWEQHVQGHLDKLAERLEIKASQETAWQNFSSAFRDTMQMHAMMGHPGIGDPGKSTDADAASLARQQADRASERARKLAQLADATAALQQALSADQRLVFNEAARHFEREHGVHGGMEALADNGYHGAHGGMGGHCERHGDNDESRDDDPDRHAHGEHGHDGRGAMAPPHEADAPQGSAAH
jgi:hypothetical protein